MEKKFTKQQKNAIISRDGSVLVSAAAGSGKTAILVERVIERICDKTNPCDADSLLIVTFTKAAAGEMKDRISNALDKKIKSEADNGYYIKQKILLNSAQISTIDSFCNSLVKEHFTQIGISPDFRIGDDKELCLLYEEALAKTLEKYYKENDKDFIELSELLFRGRDDSELAESILKLFEYSQAYPYPELWLKGIEKNFDCHSEITESPFGKYVSQYVLSACEYCFSVINRMRTVINDNPEYERVYSNALSSDEGLIKSFCEKITSGDWNGAFELTRVVFSRKGNTPTELKDTPEAVILSSNRDIVKKTFKELIPKYMCVMSEENKEDIEFLIPKIKMLISCVCDFSKELFALKQEKNVYDFSDISHMALSLLADEKGNKTLLAGELSKRYCEILIDEYQDTNKAQDMIFTSISKNGDNLFRVGDVKQSIYSFRQAMPEIFVDLRNKLSMFDGNTYPCKIILDKNFRSRKGITDCINFIFSQIMSKESSSIDYDEAEQLVYGETFDKTNYPQCEFHIIDTCEMEEADLENSEIQARYIASLVKEILSSGRMIKDGDKFRPVQKRDICVLMRSIKNNGQIFADAMKKWDIDCYTEVTGNFFDATEVKIMLSLLRVIDNPVQDIPLISVMMSPIFSFSADEISLLRISNQNGSLYSCLIDAQDNNEKVSSFLTFIRKMRFLSATSSASSLIRRIYEETSFPALIMAMKEPEKRRFNLKLLIDYANEYESTGKIGVAGFIRFIDRLIERKEEIDASHLVSENADVVRIMTIHKSKGLEFPICIVANLQKKFNTSDETSDLVINSKFGLGLKRRNLQTLAQYDTLSHSASSLMMHISSRAEEQRVLYVALTRAKEDLIMVTSLKDVQKTVSNLASDIDLSKRQLAAFSVVNRNCYQDWIIKALIRHKDCKKLREYAGIDEEYIISSDFDIKLVITNKLKTYSGSKTTIDFEEEIDFDFQKMLNDKINYEYKYSSLIGVATKRSASNSQKGVLCKERFADTIPKFIKGDKLTSAEKGTALHRFLECANYQNAKVDIKTEIKRLLENKKLTRAQADCLNISSINNFLESDLANRFLRSKNVFREKKFTVYVPLRLFYPEKENDFGEKIMIQGIIDCAFEEDEAVVLLDYKTDKIEKEEELTERYKTQLMSYKFALEQIQPKKVKEMYFYSFYLGKEVKVDMGDADI